MLWRVFCFKDFKHPRIAAYLGFPPLHFAFWTAENCWEVYGKVLLLPEYSEREGPEHQWLPELKLLPLLHDMAPSEDKGRVERSEEEGLLPGDTINQRRCDNSLNINECWISWSMKLHPDSLKPLEASFYSTNRFLKPAAVTGMLFRQETGFTGQFACRLRRPPSQMHLPCSSLERSGAEQQSASGTDLTHPTVLSLLIQTLSNMAATEQSQACLVEGCSVWSLPHPPPFDGDSSLVHVVKMLDPMLVPKSHTLNCFFFNFIII